MIDSEVLTALASSDGEFASNATVEARVMAAFGLVSNGSVSNGFPPRGVSAAPAHDLTNIPLDVDELETLQDLVVRYDQVVQDLDVLNKQIESLLASEGIKGCDS